MTQSNLSSTHIIVIGNEKGGTNLVLESIHEGKNIPLRMAPMIFVATILTHLGGGSAGREGAALQLGGSIAQFLGKIFRLDEKNTKLIIMCGMSADQENNSSITP